MLSESESKNAGFQVQKITKTSLNNQPHWKKIKILEVVQTSESIELPTGFVLS